MRFATVISLLLHVALVGVWFIMPDSWRPTMQSDPIVPIEIISEAELSERLSVPETRVEPEPAEEEAPVAVEEEPVPQPRTEPEPEPEQIPEPVIREEEPEPEPEEPEPEPEEEEPEPEPEPEAEPEPTPPQPEPQPRNDELDLDALESALTDLDPDERQTATPREAPDETGQAEQGERDQNRVGLGDKITASEEARVKAKMAGCWNAQNFIGAPEPEKLVVRVSLDLNRDGSLKAEPRVLNSRQIRTSGNAYWLVAERNAVSAVKQCAPYDMLSPDRYNVWQSITFNFDPSQMAGF